MHLDTLVTDKGTLSVGITDIGNSNKLNTDQLLELVSGLDDRVMAVQLFNAAMIVDVNHLLSASQNAINAWNGNYSQSRSLSVEIAVFASGQHQIGRALSSIGITDNLPSIAAVVIAHGQDEVTQCIRELTKAIGGPSKLEFPPDHKRLEKIMEYFGIARSELDVFLKSSTPQDFQNALSKCVVSRVSTVAFDI